MALMQIYSQSSHFQPQLRTTSPCPLFPGFGWDYGLFPPPLLAPMSRSPLCLLPSLCSYFPSSYTFVTALVKCSNVLLAFV